MTDQNRAFDPTHVLVLATSGDAGTEAEVTAAAVEAVLDRADVVSVRVDTDALASDFPTLARRLGDAAGSDDEDDVTCRSVDAIREPLSDLLAQSIVHRFVTLERLDAFRDGHRVLGYVPDHHRFELDAAADEGLVDAVATAIADRPAGLLPATVLADWYEDGTHYELEPPSLCVDGDTCFALRSIEGVAFDGDDHEIRLTWTSEGGVAAAVLDFVGASRPERFRFDSPNRYEAVARAFRRLADALDLDVADANA
jgi:hypothetical protein